MTTTARQGGVWLRSRGASFLPREHGFWAMLAAVVLAALLRSKPSPAVALTAVAVVAVAVSLGGIFRLSIRRNESLQLASAALMALAGIPIQLAAGEKLGLIALTALAWAVVFTSSALNVRASFARVSRAQRSKAKSLQFGAVALPCVFALLFSLGGFVAQTVATLIAAAGSVTLGALRPGVKRMKAVGLSLAGVALTAALALAFL